MLKSTAVLPSPYYSRKLYIYVHTPFFSAFRPVCKEVGTEYVYKNWIILKTIFKIFKLSYHFSCELGQPLKRKLVIFILSRMNFLLDYVGKTLQVSQTIKLPFVLMDTLQFYFNYCSYQIYSSRKKKKITSLQDIDKNENFKVKKQNKNVHILLQYLDNLINAKFLKTLRNVLIHRMLFKFQRE